MGNGVVMAECAPILPSVGDALSWSQAQPGNFETEGRLEDGGDR